MPQIDVPIYASAIGIQALSAQDFEIIKLLIQFIFGVIVFILITLPSSVRSRIQLDINRLDETRKIVEKFESVYGWDGFVLDEDGKKLDLLYVLNSATTWRRAPHYSTSYVDGERYVDFVLHSSVVSRRAIISIDRLHDVSNLFRHIGVALSTGTLKSRDVTVFWNHVMVWTYPGRLSFLTSCLGATRSEFSSIIDLLCRKFPINSYVYSNGEKDYFYYVLRGGEWPNSAMGPRARMRLQFVRYVRSLNSRFDVALMVMLDSIARAIRVF